MPDTLARPDKGTRIYLGCSAAFLCLFLVAGLLVVGVVALGDMPEKLPPLLGGLVFVVVPAGGLLLVRWLWKQAALREQRRLRSPDQPWAWNQDVSTGVVSGASPTAGIVVWVLFAGSWLGFMALVTVLGWEQIRGQAGLMAVLGVFWLAGLFLAGMAVTTILRARRFGRSTLALDSVPARLGGWLSGVVRAPQSVQGAELQVTVECIKTTYHQSSSSSSGSSRSTWTMWRTTRVIDGARCPLHAEGVEIPFAVRLPTNEEVSRERDGNVLASVLGSSTVDLVGSDMDWYVGVKGRMSGVDYADRFAVPVAAPEAGAAPAAATPPREMPELTGDRLAARLPGRLEVGTDADVFVFPVKVSWLVWILVLGAVSGVCLFQVLVGGIALLDPLGPALRWIGLVAGGIDVLCVVGLMLDTRRIEVAPQAVRVRRGLLGVGFHRTIPRSEITMVEEEASRSDPPTYSVNIKTHDGKSYWAALALSEPDQAAALATRLRDVLQLAARR